jgi:mono/diheme cytochrome c family protein
MILLLAACVTDPVLAREGDVDRGAALYATECVLCHGVDGAGTSRGPAAVAPPDDRAAIDLLDAIRFGRGEMPAYDLSDQELADLLAWWSR